RINGGAATTASRCAAATCSPLSVASGITSSHWSAIWRASLMPEQDLDRWSALVGQRVGSSGITLSADATDELACYCADLSADARAGGASDAEAEALVVRALERSSVDELRGRHRAVPAIRSRLFERTPSRARRWWDDAVFDLRYALRAMPRQVAFTLAVVS